MSLVWHDVVAAHMDVSVTGTFDVLLVSRIALGAHVLLSSEVSFAIREVVIYRA